MSRHSLDYFRYFPVHPDIQRWGLGVTACGVTRIPAGSPYPPIQHPTDHHFNWDQGRVLDCIQIVLIPVGRGVLESRDGVKTPIGPGQAFALLPGIWHRYQPDTSTGWNESWVELRGPVIDNLVGSSITETSSFRQNALSSGLNTALDAIHNRARNALPGFDPEMSALGLGVLAAWMRAGKESPAQSNITRAVIAAERHFIEHQNEPINISKLAQNLGIAYSHFRREFKAHTGYSPWQYVLYLRLSRAQRLLASSDATLDDIASRVGFSSGFHLSSIFKKNFHLAPQTWRQQLRNGQHIEKPASPRRKR